jgi:hypothetical protein
MLDADAMWRAPATRTGVLLLAAAVVLLVAWPAS